jgi:hypothetical protein
MNLEDKLAKNNSKHWIRLCSPTYDMTSPPSEAPEETIPVARALRL